MEKNKNTFTIGDVVEHKKWDSVGTIKSFRKLGQYILIIIDWNIKNNVGDDSEASLKDIEHYVKQQSTITEDLITVQLTKEKYDLLMQLLEE